MAPELPDQEDFCLSGPVIAVPLDLGGRGYRPLTPCSIPMCVVVTDVSQVVEIRARKDYSPPGVVIDIRRADAESPGDE